jgi:AraC-like DNA-binding protein
MVNFIQAGRVLPSPDWKMKRHAHKDRNEIIIPLSGKLHLRFEGCKETVLKPGSTALYCRNSWHEEWSDPDSPVDLAFFSFRGDAGKGIRIIHDPHKKITQLAKNMDEARWREENKSLLESYANAIYEEFLFLESQDEEDELVARTRSIMLQNLNAPLSVDKLASQVHMSKYHFIRTYKRKCGITPAQDYTRLRIEESANLIATTNLPLKAVADMMGFVNEYHFSRLFKKVIGTPPGKYRRDSE